jgi:hypothetical protein
LKLTAGLVPAWTVIRQVMGLNVLLPQVVLSPKSHGAVPPQKFAHPSGVP